MNLQPSGYEPDELPIAPPRGVEPQVYGFFGGKQAVPWGMGNREWGMAVPDLPSQPSSPVFRQPTGHLMHRHRFVYNYDCRKPLAPTIFGSIDYRKRVK